MEYRETLTGKLIEKFLEFLKKDHRRPDVSIVRKIIGAVFANTPIGPILNNLIDGMKSYNQMGRIDKYKYPKAYERLSESLIANLSRGLVELRYNILSPFFGLGNLASGGALKGLVEGFTSVMHERRLGYGVAGIKGRVELHGGLNKYYKNIFFKLGSVLRIFPDTLASIPLATVFGVSGAFSGLGSTIVGVMDKLKIPQIAEFLINFGSKNADKSVSSFIPRLVSFLAEQVKKLTEALANLQSANPPRAETKSAS